MTGTASHQGAHALSGYELLDVLGRGAQGTVHRARAQDGRVVALKDLGVLHASERARMVRATELARRLDHPNVVRLDAVFEHAGRSYLPMELVDGESVLRWVRSEGVLDFARVRDAFAQLAQALAALHDVGLVHRDVKPSNVRVAPTGRVVLLDFGLVTERSFEESRPAVGTAAYAAPEQLAGDVIGPAADMFSLGVVLFEALFGRVPHLGTDPAALLRAKSIELEITPTLLIQAPEDLSALCLRLLDPMPERRPSARELLRLLGAEPRTSGVRGPSAFPRRRVFVGHEKLLARIVEAVREARELAREINLVGPAGVGKSATLDEVCTSIAREQSKTRIVRCEAFETQAMPWAYASPLLDLLTELGDEVDLEPKQRAAVEQLWPALVPLDRTPVFVPLPTDARERRRLAFEGLAGMLATAARRTRTLIVLDDLERADTDSRALLDELARSGAPVVWLSASERVILLGGRDGESVTLAPFADSEARELVRAHLEGMGDHELADAVRFARGSPLALMEWMRFHLVGLAMPEGAGVTALFLARLRTLPEPTRRIAELVCLAGMPIARDQVLLASGVGLDAFMAAMSALKAGGFIVSSGGANDEIVRAPHPALTRALAGSMSAEVRRERHTSLAAVYAGHERRGYTAGLAHALAGELIEQAAELAERGAELARDRLAYARAAELWERLMIVDVARHGSAPRTRWEQLAQAMTLAGRRFEAALACVQAMQGAPSADALDWQRRAATNLMHAGAIPEAMAATRRMLTNVGLTMADSPGRALPSLLWGRAVVALRGSGVKPLHEQQVPKVVLSRIDTLWSAGALLGMADHIIGADVQTRGLRLALKVGEPRRAARALALEAFFQSGNASRARELLARAASLGRGHPLTEVLVELARGTIDLFHGSYDEAARVLSTAEQRVCVDVADAEWELTIIRDMRALALYLLGRFRECKDAVRHARADAAQRSDWYGYARITTSWAGPMAMLTDDPERSARDLDDAARRWVAPGFHLHHAFRVYSEAWIALYRGDERAESRLAEAWPQLERSHLLRVPVMQALFFHIRGLVCGASALRSPSEAKRRARAIERDAALLKATGLAPVACSSELLRVEAALIRGDHERALRDLAGAATVPSGFGPRVVVDYALGRLVGGDEGKTLCDDAIARATQAGVVDVTRMARTLIPHLP